MADGLVSCFQKIDLLADRLRQNNYRKLEFDIKIIRIKIWEVDKNIDNTIENQSVNTGACVIVLYTYRKLHVLKCPFYSHTSPIDVTVFIYYCNIATLTAFDAYFWNGVSGMS